MNQFSNHNYQFNIFNQHKYLQQYYFWRLDPFLHWIITGRVFKQATPTLYMFEHVEVCKVLLKYSTKTNDLETELIS